eukprot:gene8718-664_t
MNPIKVCELEEFFPGKKKIIELENKQVVIFRLETGEFYALDNKCYHAGGPLNQGDIEDWDERHCIKCPWHHYVIDLATGEGLYQNLKREIKSKGVKQRTHQVKIMDDFVYLILSDGTNKFESDFYDKNTIKKTSWKLDELKK